MNTLVKAFDFCVFIGRFQPFHTGHLRVVREGLVRADRVIVLVGSAHQARSLRNPWTFDERKAMILESVEQGDRDRVVVAPLMDHMYNDAAWVKSVQTTVMGLANAYHRKVQQAPKISLIGHSKDHTSYYLNLFPQWGSVDVPSSTALNATDIRTRLFGARSEPKREQVPAAVRAQIQSFMRSPDHEQLCAEHQFIEGYREQWASAPYPPTFVTVDAVVVQSGHVLMIERRQMPGKGRWALPGGFIDANESLDDACLRELNEETRIKVPKAVLAGHIRQTRVFDDPNRSSRGRTITHAYHIELSASAELPKVRASSDAGKAFWIPLADLDPARCFEDHYFIVQHFIGD